MSNQLIDEIIRKLTEVNLLTRTLIPGQNGIDEFVQDDALNERQRLILSSIISCSLPSINNRLAREIVGNQHSSESIRRDLMGLCRMGYLVERGKNRGRYYVLSRTVLKSTPPQ